MSASDPIAKALDKLTKARDHLSSAHGVEGGWLLSTARGNKIGKLMDDAIRGIRRTRQPRGEGEAQPPR